jgi:hypothetical protein
MAEMSGITHRGGVRTRHHPDQEFSLISPARARPRQAMFGLAFFLAAVAALVLLAPAAHAAKLQVDPDAPLWARIGADVLLWAHIGGGAAGIATGAVALASRKGARIHRSAGKMFFGVMLLCYVVATGVAPFLHVEQRTNTIAGLMALYLLLSGWAASQHKDIKAGPQQAVGLVFALGIAVAGALFMQMGANSPTGTVDGAPPQAFILFMLIGVFAAGGEINTLVRRTISGPARLARHLWRMCSSLFIASGSFFLGQALFLPDWVRSSMINVALALAPLVAMLIYLVLVRLPKRRERAQAGTIAAAAD